MRSSDTSYAPGFATMRGMPQAFEPHPITLPTLGPAILGPAEEMVTVLLVDGAGKPHPAVIIASKQEGLPALALAFRPTREQAERMSRTLKAFAEGREEDLLKGIRS